ncbi:helix-turn-helix transcriptional regulator [Clostridium sp. KNHs214]|uniref:helix-turn-helix domain-containing protein n=1 Tax=Clostridium sp. KNHs214 TaxID=1540257 RepID=UPI00054DCB9E|nr:helix-turn-helix transcriptional regulator [Clostridium sp. KNHs214]
MNLSIGEKIKRLRKELSMTQAELAEPEMTKGMLSHIENGHANPSMKNLQYIAKKLNTPIAYFLQNEEEDAQYIDNNCLPFNKILKELEEIDVFLRSNKFEAAKEKANNLLDIYKFQEKSKLYADILYRLGSCHVALSEFKEGTKIINLCCEIYKYNRLYIDASRAYMKLCRETLEKYDYDKCRNILEEAQSLYDKSSSRDVFLEIKLLITQPAILFAKGEFQKAIEMCEKSIILSNENNIYYYIDDAYRIEAIIYLMREEYEKFLVNAHKAKQYGEFTDNKLNLAKIYHNYAKYENKINKPCEALKYLELLEINAREKSFYYYVEHGKANYLLSNYNNAIEDFSKIDYKHKIPHIIDCVYILTGKIYEGLAYGKLKEYDKAVSKIESFIKEVEIYITLEYKGIVQYAYMNLGFAYESLSEIYSQKEEYETAYTLLKKANELKLLSRQ